MPVKTIALFLASLLICHSSKAQDLVIEKAWTGDKITFTVLREVNIFNYVIEAGNDSLNMEIIGVIKAKGYSMFPVNYEFESSEKSYPNYRVKQIDISGSCVAQMKSKSNRNHPPALYPLDSIVARGVPLER